MQFILAYVTVVRLRAVAPLATSRGAYLSIVMMMVSFLRALGKAAQHEDKLPKIMMAPIAVACIAAMVIEYLVFQCNALTAFARVAMDVHAR